MGRTADLESRRRSAGSYHEAMTLCPDARRVELQYPLTLAQPRNTESLVDFPSAGGYLRPYLQAMAPRAKYFAVEHVQGYNEASPDLCEGTWNNLGFDNQSVDIVLCLAALHHVYPQRSLFYDECYRVLGEGGRLVIGDVAEGTDSARFLDEFVDTYSPEGHDAKFIQAEHDAAEIEASGFDISHWEVKNFFWYYPSPEVAVNFCRGLFRLHDASDTQIWDGLDSFLGIKKTPSGVAMSWQLVFVRADKKI